MQWSETKPVGIRTTRNAIKVLSMDTSETIHPPCSRPPPQIPPFGGVAWPSVRVSFVMRLAIAQPNVSDVCNYIYATQWQIEGGVGGVVGESLDRSVRT